MNVPGDRAATEQTNHSAEAERRFGPPAGIVRRWSAVGWATIAQRPVIIVPIGGSRDKQWFGERSTAADSGRPMDRWKAHARETRCPSFDSGIAIADRTIEADDDENRRIWPTQASPPRRSLSPSSRV